MIFLSFYYSIVILDAHFSFARSHTGTKGSINKLWLQSKTQVNTELIDRFENIDLIFATISFSKDLVIQSTHGVVRSNFMAFWFD